MIKSNISWECSECIQNKRRSLVRDISSDDKINPDEDESFTIGDIMRKIRENREKVARDMQIFLKEVGQTLQFMSDSFDEMKQKNKLIRKKWKTSRKYVAHNRIKLLEERVEDLDQEGTNGNILLTNVPSQKSEKYRDGTKTC